MRKLITPNEGANNNVLHTFAQNFKCCPLQIKLLLLKNDNENETKHM